MKITKILVWLVGCIALLSFIASGLGVFWQGNGPRQNFITLHGETVSILGSGLYRFDTVTNASQVIAQDVVTLILGIPLLIISTGLYLKDLLRGKLMLCGTLAYFLYTYTSYTMLVAYNGLFLVYVALFSLSLFAFILALMSIELEALPAHFSVRLPRKSIATFLFVLASFLLLAWVARIGSGLLKDLPPVGLESSTTLVIQALDLGILVPLSYLAGILLLKRRAWGYLLSSIVLFKSLTLGTAICAMVLGQILAGVEVGLVEAILFPAISLVGIGLTIALLKNITEKVAGYNETLLFQK